MKTKRFDGRDARRVLRGMVTDATFLARVAERWRSPGLFGSRWANLVGGWCVEYLREHGSAPNGQLKHLYAEWAMSSNTDDATTETVEKFLRYVAEEKDEPTDRLLDVACRHLNAVRLRRLVSEVSDDIERGRVDDAYGRVTSATAIDLGDGDLVRPHEDFEAWRQAFDVENRRPFLPYPKGFGELVGNMFARRSFIAWMAPDKTGKSFWLLDLAVRAVRAHRRVAFFDCGDMDRDEVLLRLARRCLRRPAGGGTVRWPVAWGEDDVPVVEERRCEPIGPAEAYRTFRRISGERERMRLTCRPAGTLSVDDVTATIREWAREGWTADVVVLDYADILAPPAGVRETLDRIDETWKRLRRLSQEMDCLVVTATQTNAAAYAVKEGASLGKRHFSGRKTKLAHVNGMLAIVATDEEKSQGVCRVNWVVRRKGGFREGQSARVAGCLAAACPLVISSFSRGSGRENV